jgi:hypothetical protein
MATIKSYTDISQSKTLSKILPLESADMYYDITASDIDGEKAVAEVLHRKLTKNDCEVVDPCWSLASLLEQLPYELCDDDGNSVYLEINKEDDLYQLVYTDPYGDFKSIETDRYEHFVDACYELILKLHELKLL